MTRFSASCRFRFKSSPGCEYKGPGEVCDKTFARCCELRNRERFGGFRHLPEIEGKEIAWGNRVIDGSGFRFVEEKS